MRHLHSALAVVAALLTSSIAYAGEDRVEDYGVSAVRPCPTVNHPPSVAEAAQLVACEGSYDNFGHANVYRTYNVRVQIAGPRAYTYGDPGGNEIDPGAPVYPIRGSKSDALCTPLSDDRSDVGKNCLVADSSGSGICYRTPFGDWKCHLSEDKRDVRYHAPPPQ